MSRLKKIVLYVHHFHTSPHHRGGVRANLSGQTPPVFLSSSGSVKKGGANPGRLLSSSGSVSVLQ